MIINFEKEIMLRLKTFFVLCIGLLLISCSHKETVHGHYLKDNEIAKLKIGKSTKADAKYLLGTPSASDPFQDQNWYYIGQTNKKKILSKPQILDRQITVLTFNQKDVLTGIVEMDHNDSRAVDMIHRQTKTAGKEPSFVQQFVGNFGRFKQQREKEYNQKKN